MPSRTMTRLRLRADLQVELQPEGGAGLSMGVTSDADGVLRVRVDQLPTLALKAAQPFAAGAIRRLVDAGLTVVVEAPRGELVTFGAAVKTPWWQRPFLPVRHTRVLDLGAMFTWYRASSRRRETSLLPSATLPRLSAPPGTLFPLAPTLGTTPRVTTTNDPAGGGRPRLFFPPASKAGSVLRVFYLKPRTIVGDSPESDLRLEGVSTRQAVIRRTDDDEYVIAPDPGGMPVLVNGRPISGQETLRTGTRVEIGTWRMSYFREEYADHGRPYGGRVGGEIGHQRPQATPRYRPDSKP